MDLVKNFFKGPRASQTKNISNESESSIYIIDEYIKQLENMNLSLPSTKEDLLIQKSDSSTIIKKIIYHFDVILMDKLKVASDKFSRSSSNISDELHYWKYLSKYFQISSVKFINNFYEKIQTIPEKGLAWIYISISEKSFYESIIEIYGQGFEKKFYNEDALINKRKTDILRISEKICKFEFINKKIELEEEYLLYKKQKEKEGKYGDSNEIELPSVSPISYRKKENYFITPHALDSYGKIEFFIN
jgi:hypothetical protein